MSTKVLYIDDVADDMKQYSERLMRSHELDVVGRVPPPDLDITPLLQLQPDLVLVDYDLTKLTAENTKANYLGGSLLTSFREKKPDWPLVLFTRKALWDTFSRTVEDLNVFDEVVMKDAAETDYRTVARHLANLSVGFERLRMASKTRQSFMNILGITSSREWDVIRQAVPPLENSTWQVPKTARWIRGVFLNYPGIVYDETHASVLLGLSLDSFRDSRVQQLFRSAVYDGCFSSSHPRWWKPRLLDIAKGFAVGSSVAGPINRVFREAFDSNLQPSRCVSSGEIPADWVCHILNEPVKMRYSLSYPVDNRPAIMDEARVSFKAILETDRVDENLLDPTSRAIVDDLRKRG